MKFSIKNLSSKCDQIRSFLRIGSHLLKKSLMENFIFCAVFGIIYLLGKVLIAVFYDCETSELMEGSLTVSQSKSSLKLFCSARSRL